MPPRDLEATWKDETFPEPTRSPLLTSRAIQTVAGTTVIQKKHSRITVNLKLDITGSSFVFQRLECTKVFQNQAVHSREDTAHSQQKENQNRQVKRSFSCKYLIYYLDYCRKSGNGGPGYEMRWAPAEDFMELKVMPRMLLDHLPDNVYKVLDTILREQKDNVSEII